MGLFNWKSKKRSVELKAPLSGTVIALEQVPDPVFAQKMMGEGLAIQPSGNTVVAPADGTVTMIASTKHAFGMQLDNGLELMIHFGLETVNLQGEGFDVLHKVGDRVSAGTPILKVNVDFMNEKGLCLTTPFILINHAEHPFTIIKGEGTVTAGEDVLFEIKG